MRALTWTPWVELFGAPSGRARPVNIFGEYTDSIIGADVLGRGHVSFLPKPFDADKFLQSVRRRLDAS